MQPLVLTSIEAGVVGGGDAAVEGGPREMKENDGVSWTGRMLGNGEPIGESGRNAAWNKNDFF